MAHPKVLRGINSKETQKTINLQTAERDKPLEYYEQFLRKKVVQWGSTRKRKYKSRSINNRRKSRKYSRRRRQTTKK
jgi:hypothetical protein